MRTFLATAAIILLPTFANAQQRENTVDTLDLINGNYISRLLLVSDSTFFIRNSRRIDSDSEVTKGRWFRVGDKIHLVGGTDCETNFNLKISTQIVEDTVTKFVFKDLYGTPLSKWPVIFFDTAFRQTNLVTDSNGVIQIKKGKLIAFLSEFEMRQLNVGDAVNDKVHFMWDKLTRYEVIINYPTIILSSQSWTDIYKLDRKVLKVSGKKLIDVNTKSIYLQK